ncbi:hypothetical protein Lepto7375DRAFT_1685 [Leptolyngbya sp. PCC 7375]|nr:hypothetical protein Lepto7375DRAFT_1685 [Leptolyngbya sp. PCC 7375]
MFGYGERAGVTPARGVLEISHTLTGFINFSNYLKNSDLPELECSFNNTPINNECAITTRHHH